MNITKNLKILSFITIFSLLLIGCNGKLPGGDARKSSPNPEERVKKNLEEGRAFKLMDLGKNKGGVFEFASSNELWRASLDVIDFMPLSSVNYSGGIIITDWYSNEKKQNESIKISIRFLTNEIRSDALNIKVFTRKCEMNLMNCKYLESNDVLVTELKKEILKKAAIYKKQNLKKPKNNSWTSKPKKD
jgi:small-conductance mechanosensitive channel